MAWPSACTLAGARWRWSLGSFGAAWAPLPLWLRWCSMAWPVRARGSGAAALALRPSPSRRCCMTLCCGQWASSQSGAPCWSQCWWQARGQARGAGAGAGAGAGEKALPLPLPLLSPRDVHVNGRAAHALTLTSTSTGRKRSISSTRRESLHLEQLALSRAAERAVGPDLARGSPVTDAPLQGLLEEPLRGPRHSSTRPRRTRGSCRPLAWCCAGNAGTSS